MSKKLTKYIICTGPECTGKSTLTLALSQHYNRPYIPEYARYFLQSFQGVYSYETVECIARQQHRALLEYYVLSSPVIVDTWLCVIAIWMEVKFGRISDWVLPEIKRHQSQVHFLLCYPDIPWVKDPLREDSDSRVEIFNKYQELMDACGVHYAIISGNDRVEQAISIIESDATPV